MALVYIWAGENQVIF